MLYLQPLALSSCFYWLYLLALPDLPGCLQPGRSLECWTGSKAWKKIFLYKRQGPRRLGRLADTTGGGHTIA